MKGVAKETKALQVMSYLFYYSVANWLAEYLLVIVISLKNTYTMFRTKFVGICNITQESIENVQIYLVVLRYKAYVYIIYEING